MLRASMPVAIPDPLDQWAALVEIGAELHQRPLSDLVVIVGPKRAGLPLAALARAPFHMCVATLEDVEVWARGNTLREQSIAGLRGPLPEGRAWTLAAALTPDGLLVMLFNHDVVQPSPRARHYTRLALVPPDGGPAPGRLITARGGAS